MNKTKTIVLWLLTAVGFFAVGMVVANTWVTLETSDLSVITDANSAFLSTSFQVVKLLPYIAVIAWGFYLLNKVFGIIPRSWN